MFEGRRLTGCDDFISKEEDDVLEGRFIQVFYKVVNDNDCYISNYFTNCLTCEHATSTVEDSKGDNGGNEHDNIDRYSESVRE